MTGTERTDQILFMTTEIEGSIKYIMGIADPFRTNTENRMDPTIQPAITHLNQVTGTGHSDCNHFNLGSLDGGHRIPTCTGKRTKDGKIISPPWERNRQQTDGDRNA